ncbi:MAG: sigma-54-dependent Fis family transcriptional regulator [Rhodospirillales bacterium]
MTNGKAEGTLVGLLSLSADGEVTAALGRGRDAAVQTALRRPGFRQALAQRRLGALPDLGLAVLWAPLGEEALFLLSDGRPAVLEFLLGVDIAYDILEHLLSDPFDAMTVVDAEARVAYVAPVHERFFGFSRGSANGRPVEEAIENTRLHQVVKSGRAEIGETQSMRGVTRVVNRTPIRDADGKILGAIGRVLFKGPKQLGDLNQRINALENEVAFYRREARAARERRYGLDDLIGESAALQRLKREIVQVAPLDVPVLITGESGVGKELVAQALHRLSPRREQPLVAVNAAALPDSLVESELFGYEAGAFTGADRRGRAGKFEQAAGGTLFLDEIGEMPAAVQAKLLRVLQDGRVERLGGQAESVDFRLIAATNAELEARVAEGDFRLDLFYRISPVVLRVPPLSERLEDLPALVAHFLRDFAERHGRACLDLAPEVLPLLAAQPWPGNLRQLKHAVERAAIFAQGLKLTAASFDAGGAAPQALASDAVEPLQVALERVEAQLIEAALQASDGNKTQAAERLGISRSYLYKKLG